MAKKRKVLPGAVVQQVLLNCKRRCCICYAAGKDDVREGNISHLKRIGESDMESEDNLVFLCYQHHREMETGKLDAEEVRTARQELYRFLSQPSELSEAEVASPWLRYEKKVYDLFYNAFSAESHCSGNAHSNRPFAGRSGAIREVGISATVSVAGLRLLIVVEAKYSRSKLSLDAVDSFAGLLQDIGANKGIFVTNTGFTDSAKKIAKSHGIALATIGENDMDFKAGILLDPLVGPSD
jgi:Restriction endonuclease